MSVRHILTFVLFPCFFFQAECPLCREPVQLSRLVFLHHYEPTWPTTETHFDTVCWEAFKYNQSGCRQLWAVHVLDAWVDARVACLLKYWSFKTPTAQKTRHTVEIHSSSWGWEVDKKIKSRGTKPFARRNKVLWTVKTVSALDQPAVPTRSHRGAVHVQRSFNPETWN